MPRDPRADMMKLHLHYDIEVVQDRNVTVATLVPPPGSPLMLVGSAKRAPGDKFSPDVGVQVALARLVRHMAQSLQDAADILVAKNCGLAEPDPEQPEPANLADRFKEAFGL